MQIRRFGKIGYGAICFMLWKEYLRRMWVFLLCLETKRKCPFCKADLRGKTDLDRVEELKKRMEVNDAGAIYALQ
jgi:TPR repeat protein